MDFFGYSIWSELLEGHPDWMQALHLGDSKELDFENSVNNPWVIIFNGLEEVLHKSNLAGNLGGCLHFSSRIPAFLDNPLFNAKPYYESAFQSARSRFPLEIGMHSTFGDKECITEGKFPTILRQDLQWAKILHASVIVEHFSNRKKETIKELVNELCSEPIIKLLKESEVILAWENLGPHQKGGSLRYLVSFREALADKLAEIGEKQILHQNQFCFDTGHLLLWRNKMKYGKWFANKEIESYLPIFAKNIKVFHIHANDGTEDQHITPFSLQFFDHPSRAKIKRPLFESNSNTIMNWLEICQQNKSELGQHVHLEVLHLPFSLEQIIDFGTRINYLYK
jgi:hypothetical protein